MYKTLTIKANTSQLDWFLFLDALKRVAKMLTAGTSDMNALNMLLDSIEAYY